MFKKCDYKLDGIEQLICCSVEGEVMGFKAMSSNSLDATIDRNVNQESIREMTTRKQVSFNHYFDDSLIIAIKLIHIF